MSLRSPSRSPVAGVPARLPPARSVAWRLAASARRHPAALALVSARGEWRYDELTALADRGAGFLRAQGLSPGQAVAIAGGAHELLIASLACFAARLALLPLDPLAADLSWPRLQALAGGRLQRLAPLGDGMPSLGLRVAAQRPASTAADELALLIATSGSEGAAKVAMLSVANLDAAAAASNQRLPLAVGDVWLACLPLHHIGGMAIVGRCLRAAATLLLHEGFSATAVWRDLHARRVTHLSLVPAMLARLLDVAQGEPPPASLRHALIGGAALSQALFERAMAAGWPICPSWGMSESTAQAATLPRPGSDWRIGEVGEPLPGLLVRSGSDGRLRLRGAQVMTGYLNPDWRRGEGLDDGWLVTGDLGTMGADGHVRILGRADDMLISGGCKVHPIEIESCLAACPGVRDAALTAASDPLWGDLLVALVVGPVEPTALHAWCRQHLVAAKRPRRVIRVEALPRNAIGKLERSALRALAQASPA